MRTGAGLGSWFGPGFNLNRSDRIGRRDRYIDDLRTRLGDVDLILILPQKRWETTGATSEADREV